MNHSIIKDDEEDILILLKRNHPTTYEIHRKEIDNAKNLILTTSDKEFAVRLVKGYNDSFKLSNIENLYCGVCGHKEFREDEDED